MTNKIARILRKRNVPSTFRPLNTIRSSLRSVKDPVDPKDMKDVYVIPCSCGTPYVGETGCSINQMINEHSADIKHRRIWSSALAEHAEKTKHHVCIEDTRVISKVAHFHHWKFREAIEIEKRPRNLNRDDHWKISSCWIPTLSSKLRPRFFPTTPSSSAWFPCFSPSLPCLIIVLFSLLVSLFSFTPSRYIYIYIYIY